MLISLSAAEKKTTVSYSKHLDLSSNTFTHPENRSILGTICIKREFHSSNPCTPVVACYLATRCLRKGVLRGAHLNLLHFCLHGNHCNLVSHYRKVQETISSLYSTPSLRREPSTTLFLRMRICPDLKGIMCLGRHSL